MGRIYSRHSRQRRAFTCIRSVQLPREPRVSALLFTVRSVRRSLAVHPGDKSSDAYELPASSCTPVQFISNMLLLQTQGVNTAAPSSTCDRRIAQSSANEKRVQANTHRLPLFAVKSHWCEKREGERGRDGECDKPLKQKTVHLSFTLKPGRSRSSALQLCSEMLRIA